jgi:hypothetical protein
MRNMEMISKCLAQNDKPPWFLSREKNVEEFNDDNPTTYNENANWKGKDSDCYDEFEGKKLHQKGATLLRA